MKIYTKTGDQGQTSLATGERVPKTDLRIETYGTADELNSFFGWLHSLISEEEGREEDRAMILLIQNKLFNLGAWLAGAEGEWITEEDVTTLEQHIDTIQAMLPPQHAFMLPSGSEQIAAAHICRTVTRRLERQMLRLREVEKNDTESQKLWENALKWVNRLSDLCYVFARKCVILQKKEPILWKK